jgi:hypothetical protein
VQFFFPPAVFTGEVTLNDAPTMQKAEFTPDGLVQNPIDEFVQQPQYHS